MAGRVARDAVVAHLVPAGSGGGAEDVQYGAVGRGTDNRAGCAGRGANVEVAAGRGNAALQRCAARGLHGDDHGYPREQLAAGGHARTQRGGRGALVALYRDSRLGGGEVLQRFQRRHNLGLHDIGQRIDLVLIGGGQQGQRGGVARLGEDVAERRAGRVLQIIGVVFEHVVGVRAAVLHVDSLDLAAVAGGEHAVSRVQ